MPSSVRRTLEPFQRHRWGNCRATGWSAYGLFRAHRYHLGLNCTELTLKITDANGWLCEVKGGLIYKVSGGHHKLSGHGGSLTPSIAFPHLPPKVGAGGMS